MHTELSCRRHRYWPEAGVAFTRKCGCVLHGIEISILLWPCQDGQLEMNGDVAQLVEQRTENPCVGGSIPSITT